MNEDEIRQKFAREIVSHGWRVVRTLDDGRIVITQHHDEMTISLENLIRAIKRDGDNGGIARFAALVVASQPLPSWSQAKSGIRWSIEAGGIDFGDALRRPMTDDVERVLVYVPADESKIRWLSSADLKLWNQSDKEAWDQADRNMSDLLRAMPFSIKQVDDMKLGMFDSDSPFKAAMVLSPNLKSVLAPKLGWPLYVVMPCRDFVFLFQAKEMIPRVGRTVVKEFTDSSYPITPDVYLLSDEGIQAVGTFATKE